MDKNYNVDDILSEIKNRKSQARRNGSAPAFPAPEQDVKNLHTPKAAPAPQHEVGATASEPKADPFLGFDFRGLESSPKKNAFDFDFSQFDSVPKQKKTGFDFEIPTPAPEPKPNLNTPKAAAPEPAGFAFDIPVAHEPVPQPHAEPPAAPHKPKADDFVFEGFDFEIPAARQIPPEPQPPLAPPQTAPQGFDFGGIAPAETPASQGFAFGDAPADAEHTRILPTLSETQDWQAPDSHDLYTYDHPDYAYDEGEDTPTDFSEYNSPEDRTAVAKDIANVKLWLFLRAGLTLVLSIALLYLAFSLNNQKLPLPPFMFPETSLKAFLVVNTVLTALLALVNSSAMGGGLISFFKLRANSDSLPAFAVLACVAQGVVLLAQPNKLVETGVSPLFGVAAVIMLFNALGKMTMINRIQTNFRIIGSERPKRAVLAVESDSFCHEFLPHHTGSRPTIAYSAPAGFFTDFLGLSYSDKYDVGIHKAVAPICLGAAVLVSIVTFVFTKSVAEATTALAAVLCICATLSATFIENIPLGKLAKKIAPDGGMVSGTKAVEDFCDTKSIILTDKDLFPQGYVKLHGIKAFAEARVDEAILDAASVICAAGGALRPVFMQMIGGEEKLLRPVDNLVFENGMGISAWVDSKRILIGNRTLIKNHGIQPPTEEYEAKYTAGDTEVLYLAASGQLSAMFVVSYQCVESLAEDLDALAAHNRQLIVYTGDANITPHKLWEVYGYPEELIRIISGAWNKQYEEMATPKEKTPALIVYTGKAGAMVRAISACINARSSILAATSVQLAQIVIGYCIISLLCFMGAVSSITFTSLISYQLIWFAVVFLLQTTKAP